MEALILVLFLLIMILLGLEAYQVKRDRALLQHVVYVNGIRGKSTVTRMIAAGLKSGGWSVFCKTTGTVPRLIGTDGVERPLRRRGKANIREQARVMRMAVREHAQVLVIECMAVDPFLQEISQRKIVRSDIGVITNVRLDHTEEMGLTLEEVGRMYAENPAISMGITDRGKIALGRKGDIVIMDEGLHVEKTIIDGQIFYEAK